MLDKKPAIDNKKFQSDHLRSEYYKSKITQNIRFKTNQNDKSENSIINPNKTSSSFFNKTSSSFYNTHTNTFNGFNIARNLNEYPGMKLFHKLDPNKKPKVKLFTKLFESKLIYYIILYFYNLIYYLLIFTSLEFIKHMDDTWGIKTTLYNKIIALNCIQNCYAEGICYIENASFVISINPKNISFDRIHYLIFEGRDEVLKLCKDYGSYEEMINNLEYKDNNIYIRYKTEKLKYKIKKFDLEDRSDSNSTQLMNQEKILNLAKKHRTLTNPTIFEENIDQEEEINKQERNNNYDYNIILSSDKNSYSKY